MNNREIIEAIENRATAYKEAEARGEFRLMADVLADTLDFIATESYDFKESAVYTKMFYELKDEE
jgi:hypothetical protein